MIDWLSRTIAIMVIMCLPGVAGMYIDDHFQTKLWTPVCAAIGFVCGTGMLLFLAAKYTPEARGKPIPFEEEGEEQEDSTADSDTDSPRN